MKGGSLFSGIGAPELAMPWIDWRWCAEHDPKAKRGPGFAAEVLRQRFPNVPNLGDVEKVNWNAVEPVDLLIAGSPCQSYSVAGKRLGLDDPRGNLALVTLRVARLLRVKWLVFENVPGLLSIDRGRGFGTFLGLLGECGFGWAYRVLDAQYFGVPQRRRRVILVGYLGDWRRAAAVLFEPESLQGHTPPRRQARQAVAGTLTRSAGTRGAEDAERSQLIAPALTSNPYGDHESREGLLVAGETPAEAQAQLTAFGGNNTAGPIDVATACNAHGGPHGRMDFESETFVVEKAGTLQSDGKTAGSATLQDAAGGLLVAHTLKAEGFDASEDGTGRGVPLVAVPLQEIGKRTGRSTDDRRVGAGIGAPGDPMFTLQSGAVHGVMAFRAAGQDGFTPGPIAPPVAATSGGHAGAPTILAFSSKDHGADADEVAPTLRAMGHAGSHPNAGGQVAVAFVQNSRSEVRLVAGDGGVTGAVAADPGVQQQTYVAYRTTPNYGAYSTVDRVDALTTQTDPFSHLLAFQQNQLGEVRASELVGTLNTNSNASGRNTPMIGGGALEQTGVRRLMPVECERLQGLPDNWTLIHYSGKWAADGPRYKAIGNSMAVPKFRWVGERIRLMQAVIDAEQAGEAAA